MSNLALTRYRQIMEGWGQRNAQATWIAGVILSSCGKPGKRLDNLLCRLLRGQEITSASFIMPHECFIIDGICVRFEILDAPVDADLGQYRYVTA